MDHLKHVDFIKVLKAPNSLTDLAKQLKLSIKFDDEPQTTLLLEYIFNCVKFCYEKGFPEHRLNVVAIFSLDFILNTVMKKLTVAKAAKWMQQNIEEAVYNYLTLKQLKQLSAYLFDTVLKHYNLYLYVFNEQRENLNIKLNQTVETTPESMTANFATAVGKHIWDYNTKIKTLENEYTTQQNELYTKTTSTKTELESETHTSWSRLRECGQGKREGEPEEVVRQVADAHVRTTAETLSALIQQTACELGHMADCNTVPRPRELGSPTKYPTKTPLTARKKAGSAKSSSPKRSGSKTGRKK